jgi:hypothetical protein
MNGVIDLTAIMGANQDELTLIAAENEDRPIKSQSAGRNDAIAARGIEHHRSIARGMEMAMTCEDRCYRAEHWGPFVRSSMDRECV